MRDVFSSEATYPCQCAGFTREHLTTIVSRAKARGEAAFDIEEVLDHVVAPIVYHILYDDRELTLDYCHALLDRIQSRPTTATTPAPAGPAAAQRASNERAGRGSGRAPRAVSPKTRAARKSAGSKSPGRR